MHIYSRWDLSAELTYPSKGPRDHYITLLCITVFLSIFIIPGRALEPPLLFKVHLTVLPTGDDTSDHLCIFTYKTKCLYNKIKNCILRCSQSSVLIPLHSHDTIESTGHIHNNGKVQQPITSIMHNSAIIMQQNMNYYRNKGPTFHSSPASSPLLN